MNESVLAATQSRKAELLSVAETVFPGGVLGTFVLPKDQQLLPSHGKGSKIYDLSGREFLDYVCGGGTLILGHCHPSVVRAVLEQIGKGSQFHGSFNENSILLAQELISAVSCAEMVRFAGSGAEATFYALRLARAFTGREKILKFEGGYHGNHDYSVMSFAPDVFMEFPHPIPDSAGVPRVVEGQVLVAPYNDLKTTAEIIDRHKKELAAVIVEPLQRAISPVRGFLEGLRRLATDNHICLVFDEIVTGFRLAYGGGQQYYGVVPDLAAFGKIIGGGYPLAAIAGRGEIMELCNPRRRLSGDVYVYVSGTLNGNPVSAAAGLATLRELCKPGTYERLAKIGELIRNGLREICKQIGIAAEVLGEGPLWHILFTDRPVLNFRDVTRSDLKKLAQFQSELLSEGVYCIPKNRAFMSLAHTEEDIQRSLVAAERALIRVSDR